MHRLTPASARREARVCQTIAGIMEGSTTWSSNKFQLNFKGDRESPERVNENSSNGRKQSHKRQARRCTLRTVCKLITTVLWQFVRLATCSVDMRLGDFLGTSKIKEFLDIILKIEQAFFAQRAPALRASYLSCNNWP